MAEKDLVELQGIIVIMIQMIQIQEKDLGMIPMIPTIAKALIMIQTTPKMQETCFKDNLIYPMLSKIMKWKTLQNSILKRKELNYGKYSKVELNKT